MHSWEALFAEFFSTPNFSRMPSWNKSLTILLFKHMYVFILSFLYYGNVVVNPKPFFQIFYALVLENPKNPKNNFHTLETLWTYLCGASFVKSFLSLVYENNGSNDKTWKHTEARTKNLPKTMTFEEILMNRYFGLKRWLGLKRDRIFCFFNKNGSNFIVKGTKTRDLRVHWKYHYGPTFLRKLIGLVI